MGCSGPAAPWTRWARRALLGKDGDRDLVAEVDVDRGGIEALAPAGLRPQAHGGQYLDVWCWMFRSAPRKCWAGFSTASTGMCTAPRDSDLILASNQAMASFEID